MNCRPARPARRPGQRRVETAASHIRSITAGRVYHDGASHWARTCKPLQLGMMLIHRRSIVSGARVGFAHVRAILGVHLSASTRKVVDVRP